jgi:hypothetical protein
MKKILLAFFALTLVAGALVPAQAGPTAGGITSDGVEYVKFVPFDQSTSTGATIAGKYMYLTSWKNLSIYDISDPENPALTGYAPWGTGSPGDSPFEFENEQVATNGKILLMSESLPNSILHIWDVEDKTNPVAIAQLEGAGDHTASCILDCRWSIGSDGSLVDLKDPAKPVLMKQNWHELVGIKQGAHDVWEYKPGFILVSTLEEPFMAVDMRNPLKPKVLGLGVNPRPRSQGGFLFHSGLWPNAGKDKFVLMQGEDNANPRCDKTANGPFMTFDATTVNKDHTFRLIDRYALDNGTFTDGKPPANGLGCSAHWFTTQPGYRNGGIVAIAWYEHGTRFLNVNDDGKIEEKGWFLPYGGSTSAAYFVNKEVVYAVDYTRGIDILKWTGK